jgi:hypothetical protein
MNQITTDLERNLLGLLFLPRYRDMTLDQIRLMASGYVMPESTLERTEAEIREFITDSLKTPRLERR